MTSPKILLAVGMAAVCGCTGLASAQTAPATPATAAAVAIPAIPGTLAASAATATPSLGAVLAATPGLSITGYVSAGYAHFDTTTPGLRQFDTKQNSFSLNQAAMTLSYLPTSGAGGLVNVIAGSDAKILRNAELFGSTTNSQFDILQAYAQYATGPLTFMAGKFVTLAGAETINPTTDTNISRSLLFTYLIPLEHTGVRATYAPGSSLMLTAGLNNGWNYSSSPPDARGKTIELQVSGTPSKMFSYAVTAYSGQFPLDALVSPLAVPGVAGRRDVVDFLGTIKVTDLLSFVGNVDVLSQDTPHGKLKASGIALYANYALNTQWGLSARGEYVDDKDGLITGLTGNQLKELTLTASYKPDAPMTLMAEVRQDKSDQPIFNKNGSPASNQTSLELQAVYSF
ncbi:outer membrane beta-barrel protein [Metallibacterium sp.]|uniref:outer membrane beta-barrel protein n=1 Tax=Metallibacterium sp. TaxID=2940281 RepID=UPI00262B9B2F|nr:outer membrane beta-barrel protein [Metallibacterium sp.]